MSHVDTSEKVERATELAAVHRIVSLKAENFKRVRAVEIVPDGDVVRITGRNGQGKSSILDAIAAALGGGRNKPENPVRRGSKRAAVAIDLGDISVEWSCTAAGTAALKVCGKDGAKLNSPQAVLDRLYTDLTFDPMAFLRMTPKAQADTIKGTTGLDAQFEAFDAEYAAAEQERLIVGREVKSLEAQYAAAPDVGDGSEDEQSAESIMQEMNAAAQTRERRAKADAWLSAKRTEHAGALAGVQRIDDEITRTRARLDELEGSRAIAVTAAEVIATAIADNAPKAAAIVVPDTTALQAQLTGLTAANDAARKRRHRRELGERLKAAKDQWAKHNRAMEETGLKKSDALKAAKYPVPGLAVSDLGAVTLNGQPFEQASSAEKVRASVAIGLALNPNLRVMLVRDGSLLDSTSRDLLGQLAAEHKAQVWIEEVTDGEPVGIVIEDGEIKGGAQ